MTSRNAPCHCGSGKRFKHCHGRVGAATDIAGAEPHREQPPLARSLEQRAAEQIACGALTEAIASYQALLRLDPKNPAYLHTKGVLHDRNYERPLSFAPLLEANRIRGWNDPQLRRDLNVAVSGLVARHGTSKMLGMRKAIARATDAGTRPAKAHTPQISVVVAEPVGAELTPATILSVCEQTQMPHELVLVIAGDQLPEPVKAVLTRRPLSVSVVRDGSDSIPRRLNRGISAAQGPWIQLLLPPDRLHTDRLRRLVSSVERARTQWGLTSIRIFENGRQIDSAYARKQFSIDALRFDRVWEEETVGFAVMSPRFPGHVASNMFFHLSLYRELGGFDENRTDTYRDFALRALWLAEPIYLPEPLVECGIEWFQHPNSYELTTYREFYYRAFAAEPPTNPTAPWHGYWGYYLLHIAQRADQLGIVPDQALDKFSKRIASAVKPTAKPGGLNVIGFIRGEWGLAEVSRSLLRGCAAANVAYSIQDVYIDMPARQGNFSLANEVADALPYGCTLYSMNPDVLRSVLFHLGSDVLQGHYNIGYWFWELEDLPEEWDYAFELLDEIWVASEFVRSAVRKRTDKPVIKVPVPVDTPAPSRKYWRSDFGLPDDVFLFLFSFDFNSFVDRKNPSAVIDAFLTAFPAPTDHVGLVIKAANGDAHPARQRALLQYAGADTRIRFIFSNLTQDEIFGLQEVVDCFVSLHRAEGLGLGLAECMARGKPVVATAYSGNMEFMSRSTSCLVPYRMVQVQKGQYPYVRAASFWAEADTAIAADFMRKLANNERFADRLGQEAKRDIRDRFSRRRCGEVIARRLAAIDAQWVAR